MGSALRIAWKTVPQYADGSRVHIAVALECGNEHEADCCEHTRTKCFLYSVVRVVALE